MAEDNLAETRGSGKSFMGNPIRGLMGGTDETGMTGTTGPVWSDSDRRWGGVRLMGDVQVERGTHGNDVCQGN